MERCEDVAGNVPGRRPTRVSKLVDRSIESRLRHRGTRTCPRKICRRVPNLIFGRQAEDIDAPTLKANAIVRWQGRRDASARKHCLSSDAEGTHLNVSLVTVQRQLSASSKESRHEDEQAEIVGHRFRKALDE